jgi:hypothetical protein
MRTLTPEVSLRCNKWRSLGSILTIRSRPERCSDKSSFLLARVPKVGEQEEIVQQAIEHRDVAGQLGLPELALAGEDFIVDAHRSLFSCGVSDRVLTFPDA